MKGESASVGRDIRDYQHHIHSGNSESNIKNPPDLVIVSPLSLQRTTIRDHQTRNTEERQHDSSLSFIFKNSHMLELHAAFLLCSWHSIGNEKLVGNVRRRWVDVKEPIMVMDLVSKAIISKFSELMNDGGKQTPALKWKNII